MTRSPRRCPFRPQPGCPRKNEGDALGLRAPGTAPAVAEAKLRAPLDVSSNALRRYVAKVMAFGDDDSAGGAALVTALLWPLDEWSATATKTSPAAKRDGSDEGGEKSGENADLSGGASPRAGADAGASAAPKPAGG